MKSSFVKGKILCKNRRFPVRKTYIRNWESKMPGIAAIWGRFHGGNSDKESSHVVGISYKAR